MSDVDVVESPVVSRPSLSELRAAGLGEGEGDGRPDVAMAAGIAGGVGALCCVGAMAFAYFKGRSKGWKAGRRAERPPDSMRAGPSKKELQKSVASMKLAAVDMGGSRMSDDI